MRRKLLLLSILIAVAALLSAPFSAHAVDNTVGGGYWDQAGTWGGSIPTTSDWVNIRYAPSAVVTVRQDQGAGNLYLGNPQPGHGILVITNGTLSAPTGLHVGYNSGSTGEVFMTGGKISSDGLLNIGQNAGSYGYYTISGGTTECNRVGNEALEVGYDGNGTLNISGGLLTMNNGGFLIGHQLGSTGTVTQTGGAVIAGGGGAFCLDVGRQGFGSYTISAGTLYAATNVNVPSASGGKGSFINQSGGTVTIAGELQLARELMTNSYILSGGELNLINGISMCNQTPYSTAHFTQTGGTNMVGNHFWLGNQGAFSYARYVMGGGRLEIDSDLLMCRNSYAFADLIHTGGTIQINEKFWFASKGLSTYTNSGGILSVSNNIWFGDVNGTGSTFAIAGSQGSVTTERHLGLQQDSYVRFQMDYDGVSPINVAQTVYGTTNQPSQPTLQLDFEEFGFETNEIPLINYGTWNGIASNRFKATNFYGPIMSFDVDYGDGSADTMKVYNMVPAVVVTYPISINFGADQQIALASAGAGLPLASWNNLSDSNGVSSNMVDLVGATTDVRVTWDFGATYDTGNSGSGDEDLMAGYIDNNTANGDEAVINISNLRIYTNYHLFVYFGADQDGRKGAISVDGHETYYWNSCSALSNSFPADYQQSTWTSSVPEGAWGYPSANYAVWTNLIRSDITIRHTRLSDTNSGVFGIQIVPWGKMSVDSTLIRIY